jgi:hypothetical protein
MAMHGMLAKMQTSTFTNGDAPTKTKTNLQHQQL